MQSVTRLGVLVLFAIALAISSCGSITGSTEISDLETRNAQLKSTLDVLGTPASTIVALQQAATQSVLYENQLFEARGTALAAQATLTVIELSGGAAPVQVPANVTPIAAAPPGDQPASVPTPTSGGAPPITPPSTQTLFTQTVTSTGRDQFDCPDGITSVFDSTADTIYVVTRITNLKAGSTIGARWMSNGELYFDDVQCWIPDDDWAEVCAYCSIVPDGPAFPSGNWSVELLLDGSLKSESSFQVIDPQPEAGEDTMDDMQDSGATTQ